MKKFTMPLIVVLSVFFICAAEAKEPAKKETKGESKNAPVAPLKKTEDKKDDKTDKSADVKQGEACMDESDAAYKNKMEAAKLLQNGEMALHSGKYDKAADQFSKALELDKDNLDARLKLAWTFILAGKTDEALAHLDALEAANPVWAAVWLLKGMAYADKGSQKEAESSFAKAFSLDDKESRFAMFYSEYMERFGEKETADKLAKIYEANKEWAEIAGEAGRLYYLAGEFDKAFDLLFAACAAGYVNSVYPLILAAAASPNKDKRADKLRELIKDDKPEWAVAALGGLYYETGKKEEAKSLIDKIYQTKKECIAASYYKGLMEFEKRNDEEGARALSNVLGASAGENMLLFYNAAAALEKFGSEPLSKDAYTRFYQTAKIKRCLPELAKKAEEKIKSLK